LNLCEHPYIVYRKFSALK